MLSLGIRPATIESFSPAARLVAVLCGYEPNDGLGKQPRIAELVARNAELERAAKVLIEKISDYDLLRIDLHDVMAAARSLSQLLAAEEQQKAGK